MAYIRVGPNRLLLLDVTPTLGRRLLEIYSVSYESTNAFGLKWTASNVDYDTQGAVNAAGSGTTVTTLANINAATLYNVSGDGVYLAATNLVKSQGAFQNQPAELKAFAAGNGCTLAETADSVTLDVTPVTITFPLPNYATAANSSATYADTTIFSSSNVLAFTPPITATTQTFQNVDLNGVSYTSVNVTYLGVSLPNVYTKAEVDALLANLNPQVDVAAIKQQTLDSIQVGTADIEIDRATSGQITLNAASPIKFEALGLYTFSGTQSNSIDFDKTQANPTGTRVALASLNTASAPFTVSCMFKPDTYHSGNAICRAFQGHASFLRIFVYGNGKLYAYLGSIGGGPGVLMDSNYSPGTWYHIAVRWDGTAGCCYRNGVKITAISQPTSLNMTEPMFIGSFSSDINEKFDGQMKHIRYRAGALTDQEMVNLYNSDNQLAYTY